MYHLQNISTRLFTCIVGMLWCERSLRQKNGVIIENWKMMPRNTCHKYIFGGYCFIEHQVDNINNVVTRRQYYYKQILIMLLLVAKS